MLLQTLKTFGLDDKEIAVYLRLLQAGEQKASVLAYQMAQPRTSIQNILLRLEQEEMVHKRFEKNTALYTAVSPEEFYLNLESRLVRQQNESKKSLGALKKILPELESMMSSNKHLPGVKFFRGIEGVRKVLFDTLTSKTELKDFANIDAMFEHIKEVNDEYVAAREKLVTTTKPHLTKRSLLLETPFAHKVYESGSYSPKSHKGYKWLPAQDPRAKPHFFSIEMNIYDDKVSYLTYVENDLIGVIIENHHIFEMHSALWDMLWDSLPGVDEVKSR
ncbi:MAG: helix-turn-helix domain-containing protein [Candidatus Gracilibacteria bacterium]|jgi:sugar-specific transcriptional regulator TrmB